MIATPWDADQGEAAVAAHAAEADPHAQYVLRTEAGAAGGHAPLDGDARVPDAQLGDGAAGDTTFLRGDRTWAPAVQGDLGEVDNVLLRSDGTGGATAKGSEATLDDDGNLRIAARGLPQPVAPSAWSGASSVHDLPIPAWATETGRYFALVRVRVQQNSGSVNYSARNHHVELTFNGVSWTLDGSLAEPALGGLATTHAWSISGGTNLRFSLSGMGGGNAGNVGMVLEQFIFYGAL